MGSQESVPTIYYFSDNKGRAELIRLIYVAGGKEFNDKRITENEYFKLRAEGKFLLGQLPILEIGDVQLTQSCAMARYAARQSGLYPRDPILAARSDMVVDAWRDVLDLYYSCMFDRIFKEGNLVMVVITDEEERKRKLGEFLVHTLPLHFKLFEEILSEDDSHFLFGRTLTWADLAVFDLVCTFDISANTWKLFQYDPPNILSAYPRLQDLKQHIETIPTVRAWTEQYPF